jgi:hypothetical protein
MARGLPPDGPPYGHAAPLAPASELPPLRAPETVRRLTLAARDLLQALSPPGRAAACMPFEAESRREWTYLPGPRPGVRLGDLGGTERDRVAALLDAALSARGATEVQAIRSLDRVLAEERGSHERYDPEDYWLAVYGTPGAGGPWAWRFAGHHVAVHLTIVDDARLAATPCFFGANPATVRHGPECGRRTLADEEELARDLLARLAPERRAVAIVAATAPNDILTTHDRHADPGTPPRGLAFAAMTGEEREALVRLVRHYLGRLAPDVADAAWRRLEAADLARLAFAWAGPEARGQGHYYTVTGPSGLIEYDNTQAGANHIHAVWREWTGDWGDDLLAAHYAASHHGEMSLPKLRK